MELYLETGKQIIKTLKRNGYSAYFVGGYVRDLQLGIQSDDIDITTNATPDEVEALFEKVVATGKKFGGVTVISGSFKYEVTTYRLESNYENHRHPNDVTFSKNIEDDLMRRDFTVNQLIMDEFENVTDHHSGLTDLNNKVIRTINNPIDRFTEDALRILRAFRFVSKLGFDLEEHTFNAIKELAHLVKTISIERLMVELEKIFKGDFQKKAIKYMIESGVSKELYGLDKGLRVIEATSDFVHPLEAFIICFVVDDISDVWRFSNNQVRLIHKVMNLHEVTRDDAFNKFILFSNKLDPCLLTNRINVLLGYKDQEQFIMDMYNDMPVMDVCDLTFKGQDILQLTTLKSRSVIGLVIDDLLFNVIMGIMPNDYEVLKEFSLKRVKELQKEMGEINE